MPFAVKEHPHGAAAEYAGAARIGSGLWNSLPATLAVELVTLALGLALYLRATRALDQVGRWALWWLVVVLVGLWLGAMLGPPPPSARAVALTGLGGWLFVPWGYWIDRHRQVRVERDGCISKRAMPQSILR